MKNIEELYATFNYEEAENDPIFILTKLRICGDKSFLELKKENPSKHVWLSIELPTKVLINALLVIMHNELPFADEVQGKVTKYTETYSGEVTIQVESDRTRIIVRNENFVNLTPKVASYYLTLIQEALV